MVLGVLTKGKSEHEHWKQNYKVWITLGLSDEGKLQFRELNVCH